MMITAWEDVDIPGSVPLGPTRSQAGTVRGMRTPMTIGGHLDRAALVYGDRIGIYDEPDAPGGGLGDITYRRVQELARAQAAGLDERGIGRGERVAVLSQNSGRLLTSFFGVSGYGRVLVPINFRLSPAEIEYILEHSGASMLLVDPELAEAVAHLPVKHRVVMGTDTDGEIFLEGREPEPWDEQDEDATATINYTSGTTARPKGVEMTHRNLWSNSAIFGWHTGVSDRDTYLHTLPMFHCNGWGMPYALTAMGVPQVVLRKVDGADILRRIDAARRHAAVRRAGGRGDGARRRRHLGRRDPRPRPHPHRGRRRAAAHPHDRADRDRARLGDDPDLRPHRDRSAAHHQPHPLRVGRRCRPASAPRCCRAPGCRRWAST